MPTGYTDTIYRGEPQTFSEFAMECARNFGALLSLRDSPDAEVPEEFQPSDYHARSLTEAQKHLDEIQALSVDECAQRAADDRAAVELRIEEMERQAVELRARYEAMLDEVEIWEPPTEEHRNLKSFMRDQLEQSIRFDCGTWRPNLPTLDPGEWRDEQIARALKDIAYHSEQYAADVKRARERTAWVKALRESLP